MIRSVALGLASAALAVGSAAAADSRVASHFFRTGEVVALHGRTGLQSTIGFGEGERIENVAVGDSAAWQVVPNRRADLLFVKPVKPRARTNMTVVTDRHTYLFDLVAAPGGPAVYMLSFTYPDPPPPPAPVLPPAAITPVPQVADASPGLPAPPPARLKPTAADLNFAWEAKGPRVLLPARTFDDGQSTYLAWGPDATLPAILVKGTNGVEGPVNFTVQKGYIVVEGVPAQIILRSGKQVATLSPRTAPPQRQARHAPPPPSLPMASSVATPIRLPDPDKS